jgi:hypothetical protein
MPQRARVTSVEALDSFRADLIVYVSKARPALEEVTAEVLRAKNWLENDQRNYWENQVRRRAKALEEAAAALLSARMSNLRKETAAEQMAVLRAKRSLHEAQDKLSVVKRWARDFDNRVQPLVKQMEKMHGILATDLVQAIAYLGGAVKTLAAYAEGAPPPASAPSAESPAASSPTNQTN